MPVGVAAALEALGGEPTRIAWAPGRVNLIGDHTDYTGGLCLPMAIDRECVVAVRTTGQPGLRARSLDVDGTVGWSGSAPPADLDPPWGRFVAAAAEALGTSGAELVVSSSVPTGSGLSSSAALCVALVLALAATPERPRRVATLAREVEVVATGVPVGLMDQLASVFGAPDAALLLDCRTGTVDPVPLPPKLAVAAVHSGVPRALTDSAYAARRAACEAAARRLGLASLRDARPEQVADDPLARHVVSENARVRRAALALRAGDTAALGELFAASHASLRDDYRVSTPELDALVDLLGEEGAIGARLTGAGFGGCVVALTRPDDASRVLGRAAERYTARTGRHARVYPVRATAGAGWMSP